MGGFNSVATQIAQVSYLSIPIESQLKTWGLPCPDPELWEDGRLGEAVCTGGLHASDQTIHLSKGGEVHRDLRKGPPPGLLPHRFPHGTDMDNALEGLSGDQKAILVVMHYVPKDNIDTFLDTSRQGAYPALVLTVHTRYTLQGGFYPCEMNKRAVGDVSDAIKGLVEDP
ncbi:hypothetical protein JRQ81_005425 [Phrynocephalus forsythii]|uniref:Uncharacterized protein n=1 Tax=Phrynocephalus forsythii TaxID=171643 RepID=A0A9Q0Y3X4_9SAUR|nr:hypothetical protein JRQ81_005425 [Phrynocephalus forsythii]